MTYTTKNNWIQIEKLQNLIAPLHAKGLKSLIGFISPKRVLDLGCGTSNLSLQFLEGHNSVNSYVGIDMDKTALHLAGLKQSSFTRLYENQKVQSYLVSSEEKFDLTLCTSNTLAALGSADDLRTIIETLYKICPTLILSIVPWDKKRISYHKEFENWVCIPEIGPSFKIMNEITENKNFVLQIMKIEENKHVHSIQHKFLKLNIEQWEKLFIDAGYQKISWLNPFDGTKVNPNDIALPEFYVLCEANL